MDVIQNTLYVLTPGAYLSKDHETLRVEVEQETKLTLPFHHIETIAVFGQVLISPSLMHACATKGIAVNFFTDYGRLLARVDAPGSGNVILRRAQHRLADSNEFSVEISKRIVAGKIHNARQYILRTAREASEATSPLLDKVVFEFDQILFALKEASDLDVVRGYEGSAAEIYFRNFSLLLKQQQNDFQFTKRSRRPPRDRINALLSFCYSLLLNDCISALVSTGLDPSVGFLHEDRSGRPSLALDLMEEFRPLISDRLAVKLINKRIIGTSDFENREGGAVSLTEKGRRAVIGEYQQRKLEGVEHPILSHKTRIGQLPFLQAKLLARHLRGELEYYPPCVLR